MISPRVTSSIIKPLEIVSLYEYTYIYIYIYTCVCVCVRARVCVCVIQGKKNQHFNKNISATAFINSCQHLPTYIMMK